MSAAARAADPPFGRRLAGAGMTALSAALFGLLGFLAKTASGRGFSYEAILTSRFAIAAAVIGIVLRARGRKLLLPAPILAELALVGIVGYAATSLALFLSFALIPTGLAMTLHFLYPATIAATAALLGREKASIRTLVALAAAVVGVAVIAAPRGGSFDVRGIALALSSAFFYAVYVVGIGSSRLAGLDRFLLVFWVSLFASLALFAYSAIAGHLVLAADAIAILALVGMGVFPTVIALALFAEGVRRVGPTGAAVLSTLEPTVSVLVGMAALGERPSGAFFVGAVLVLGSSVLVALPGRPKTV